MSRFDHDAKMVVSKDGSYMVVRDEMDGLTTLFIIILCGRLQIVEYHKEFKSFPFTGCLFWFLLELARRAIRRSVLVSKLCDARLDCTIHDTK